MYYIWSFRDNEKALLCIQPYSIEADRFHPSVLSRLKEEGYEIDKRGPFSFYFGSIQTVLKEQSGGGGFQGIADVRRDGTAGGI